MRVRLALYGKLTELTGCQHAEINLSFPTTGAALRRDLIDHFPGLGTTPFAIAVDAALATDDSTIAVADVLSILPAYAGG